MNKWIIFLTLFLGTNCWLLAQKKVQFSTLDVNGGLLYVPNTIDPYTGQGIEEYENGKKQMEVNIKDGKIHGKIKEWEKNGEKIYEAEYVNGQQTGTEYQWYATGKIKLEVAYVNNKPEGKCLEYHKNGQLKSEGIFRNGVEEGKHQWWFDNGQLDKEIIYVNGKEDGKVFNWFRNGKKSAEGNYTMGEKNGKITEWFENGQVKYEANFVNGKEDGAFYYWSKNGLLLGEQLYEKGTLIEDKNYKNGNIRIHGGFVEVFNTKESFFRVNVLGDKVRSVKGKDISYIVDGKILNFYISPITTQGNEQEMLKNFLKEEVAYIKSSTNFDIKVEESFKKAKRGHEYLYWSFISPSSLDVEQKPRTVKEEHYISIICNKQVLNIYAMVTNSDDPKDIRKLLIDTAESLLIESERIDLNGLAKKLNLGR